MQKRCLTVFALVGPPVGWVVAYIQAALLTEEVDLLGSSVAEAIGSFFLLSALGFSLSYLIGVIPALLAGLAYSRIRQLCDARTSTVVAMIAGAGCSLIAPFALKIAGATDLPVILLEWQYFLLPGAGAAYVSVLITNVAYSNASRRTGAA